MFKITINTLINYENFGAHGNLMRLDKENMGHGNQQYFSIN